MNCTGKKLIFCGLGLGVLLFILNTTVYSNPVIYYISGIWIADVVTQGMGEAGILIGLLVGLVACLVISFIYCFLACRLLGKHIKQ